MVALADVGDELEEVAAVGVVAEDRGPLVATSRQVIDAVQDLETRRPRHPLTLAGARPSPQLRRHLVAQPARVQQTGPDPCCVTPVALGALFESLVTLDVRVYAQAAEARVGHLRTHGGEHEVDLIVERADGGILAIEVKLARTVSDSDLHHLHWLARQLGADLLDAIVVTTGDEAYRRRDGIAVVPAALLGP